MTAPAAAALTEEEVAGSPSWYPLETLPAGEVRLLHLAESAYAAASFLDQRLLALGYAQRTCPAALLTAAAARLAPAAHYIFHVGHVGSTLISRLVGAYPKFFSLREPALLRALAAGEGRGAGAPGLDTTVALLGRTWREPQRAVIKATSFVSELAVTLLDAPHRPVGVCVFARPQAYLAGIFAGANSRAETRLLAGARLERLARRLGEGAWRPVAGSEGELFAMSWLCEMSALRAAAERCAARVLWVDFDAFLREPQRGLQGVLAALGARVAPQELEPLVSGPLMRSYSKAPEHFYDAALRRELLLAASHEHATEVRRGMLWLERLAARYPLVARVLQ